MSDDPKKPKKKDPPVSQDYNISPSFLERLKTRGYTPIGDECAKPDADLITKTALLERDSKDTKQYVMVEDTIRPGVFVPCAVDYASV